MKENGVKTATPPLSENMDVMVHRVHTIITSMKDWNKAVVPTSDGGIVVVDGDNITKYDKNFQVIKEIDLSAAPKNQVAAPQDQH